MFTLTVTQAIYLVIAIIAVGMLIGAGIGYYAALKDVEHKQQKVLNTVAVTPYHNKERDKRRNIALGMTYGQTHHFPGS
jgi:hypothetical protein